MAITKIREIRSTLGKAIAYICNPHKTGGFLRVDSFSCFPETAAAEMEATAKRGSGRGNRIAYHLIQSFSPEDNLTLDMAFAIGKEYADAVTGGDYEYVLATHDDRGHLHNHIIFNATSFITHKKYHHGKDDIDRIMDLSDSICDRTGLSVIEERSGRKGKNHREYEESKEGLSWKDRLADIIDQAVKDSDSFEDFLDKLELEGVSVKLGKHISFKCEILGQKRACRGKKIGEGYTEEALRAKIEGNEQFLSKKKLRNPKNEKKDQKKAEKNQTEKEKRERDKKEEDAFSKASGKSDINLIVETMKLDKARKSPAYARKVNTGNISNLIRSQNFMAEHNLKTFDELSAFEDSMKQSLTAFSSVVSDEKEARKALYEKINFVQKYKKNIGVYIEWRRSGSRANFYAAHKNEIDAFQEAKVFFDNLGIKAKDLNLSVMFDEYRKMKADIEELEISLKEKRKFLKETAIVRKNMEMVLKIKKEEQKSDDEQHKTDETKRRQKGKSDHSL
ncbi:MAG: hypothetical protein E7300_03755 [Lachnospiraceae bacterium]|nr:hypothetical protein [Lachnospiraceae bacterium]